MSYTKNGYFVACGIEIFCTLIRTERTHEIYVIPDKKYCEVSTHIYVAIKK
jgi:hypothetical protein